MATLTAGGATIYHSRDSRASEIVLLVDANECVVGVHGDVELFFPPLPELPVSVWTLLDRFTEHASHAVRGVLSLHDQILTWPRVETETRTSTPRISPQRIMRATVHESSVGGADVAFSLVLRDVTAEKSALESSLEKDRVYLVGSLMSGLMHEIRSPLTALSGYVQLLRGKVNEASDLRGDLAKVEREVQRTHQLTDRILSFIRGKDLESREVDLKLVVEDAVRLLAYSIKSHRINVGIHIAPETPSIVGDSVLLTQVFVNLIQNAVKAMASAQSRGTIRIRVDSTPTSVFAFVIDDGPGIQEDMAERIFEPFFTTRPAGVGNGVGLTFCRQILDVFGAKLELCRDEPGGACFRLSFLPWSKTWCLEKSHQAKPNGHVAFAGPSPT